MKLQTRLPLQPQKDHLIDHHSRLLLLGSCFVENIGEKLEYYKFRNQINPFGIVFHPKAIETLISNAVQKNDHTEDDVFFHQELWHCFNAHSKLNNESKSALLQDLNDTSALLFEDLQNCSHIILTLGTSWVYKHLASDAIVANCHKLPQQQFQKKLLSIQDIVNSLTAIEKTIHHLNPSATILFTISPIRHLKDGFVENTQSKAHLIAAVHDFLSDKLLTGCFYFPSYEIMLDELRDYRFYTPDMLHPNTTAIQYIWEKFNHVWMNEESIKTMREVDRIQNGLLHRPFNANSEAHRQFIRQLDAQIHTLQTRFPHISFSR